MRKWIFWGEENNDALEATAVAGKGMERAESLREQSDSVLKQNVAIAERQRRLNESNGYAEAMAAYIRSTAK